MKKLMILFIFSILNTGICLAQQSEDDAKRQAYLDKIIAKEQATEARAQALHGWRFGAGFSARYFFTIGLMPATKTGLFASAGYRFNKRWYLGAETGLDITLPLTIVRKGYSNSSYNYSIDRKDPIYVPLVFEPRLYFGDYPKSGTYLFTNLGIEFSHHIIPLFLFGLGFDFHIKNKSCINTAFGLGLGSWETANGTHMATADDGDPGYDLWDGFALGFRLGYSF